jgi:hypothetical protein
MNIGYGAHLGALFPLLSIACDAVIQWAEVRDRPPAPLLAVFVVACTATLTA